MHCNLYLSAIVTIYSHIVSCYGDKVTVPLKTLVQHTCTKVPDKAEYRNKIAQVRYNNCTNFYTSPIPYAVDFSTSMCTMTEQ